MRVLFMEYIIVTKEWNKVIGIIKKKKKKKILDSCWIYLSHSMS